MARFRGEDEPGESVDDAYVIGVDLGGTYIRAVLADERDAFVERRRSMTLAKEGASAVLDRIAGMVIDLSSRVGQVAAVGIASPGPLNAKTGVVYSPPAFPDWRDVPLVRLMHERTGLPCFLGNDANVAALGEFDYGAGRGFRHLIYITVSTGIGGGVIVDGKLLEGQKGAAGEVGHMVMEQDGPLCGCGGHGCLEALASGTAIARQAREALASGRESTIGSLVGADGITAEVVAGAAKEGDALGVELIRAAGRRLGCGVINLVHVFNPQVVMIGGGVTNAGELLLEPMRETVSAGLMSVFKEDLAILLPGLGADAGLYGAVALARRGAGMLPEIPDTAKLQGHRFGP
jgi:glucokinase